VSLRIYPSILSADFVNLEAEIARISSADGVHCDVMDNHFVEAISFGPQTIRRIVQVSSVPVDVHLMIENPDKFAPGYGEIGAHSVTFHVEAAKDVEGTIRAIHDTGARAAIALKPGTAPEPYFPMFHLADMVLVMTVEPGAGGQPFIREMMTKLDTVATYVADHNLSALVQVDGGITVDTLPIARAHGADTFVAGSSVYSAGNPAENIAALRVAANHTEE
jgi:ribulose-phosphate 3-epimerase